MKARRFSRHDQEVSKLLQRLEEKGRYSIVEPEVPVYWPGTYGQKAGQLDVLTVQSFDDKKDRLTYWEVKTGSDKEGLLRAKQQFKKVTAALDKSSFPSDDYVFRFVYYNPRTETMRHYHRHNL